MVFVSVLCSDRQMTNHMKKTIASFLLAIPLFFVSCGDEEPIDPKVTTGEIVPVSSSTFVAKITINTVGTIPVLDYGFLHGYNEYLEVSENYGNKISMGSNPTEGTYEEMISVANSAFDYWNDKTTYYVRAYLTNEKGTVYGAIKSFTLPKLLLSTVTPAQGKVGDEITITGSNFSEKPEDNLVKFNETIATVKSASSTQLIVEVPDFPPTYYYDNSATITVTLGAQRVQYQYFKKIPDLADFSPKSGSFGDQLTISGSNMYGHSYTVYLGELPVSASASSDSQLTFNIPADVTSSTFSISVVIDNNIVVELPGEFTMVEPFISSISPSTSISGSLITLTGSGFNTGYYYSYNTVKFGEVTASINSATSTEITVHVPTGLDIGESYDVTVHTGVYTVTAPVKFTLSSPVLTDFSPKTASHNTYITITGSYFGNVPGSILFGSVQGYVYSWSDTSIQVQIPPSYYLSTGTYKITVNAGGQSVVSTESITIE